MGLRRLDEVSNSTAGIRPYYGSLSQSVEGVDTLQAAEPPCSVCNGPVKINLKTLVTGGLIYKTKYRVAKYMLAYKTVSQLSCSLWNTDGLRASLLRRLRS